VRLALLGPLLAEGGVQRVHDLVEDGGRDGIASVKDEEDFDAPFADWELAVRHNHIRTGGLLARRMALQWTYSLICWLVTILIFLFN
jgi:hypothetical protein